MTKPFHKDELVARIHAVVRRSKGHAQSVIKTGDITVNLDAKTVEVNGQRVHLTGKEYQMLELLSLRKGTTLTKEMFLNHLYGGMDEPELKIIDVFICKLRKKLAAAAERQATHRDRLGPRLCAARARRHPEQRRTFAPGAGGGFSPCRARAADAVRGRIKVGAAACPPAPERIFSWNCSSAAVNPARGQIKRRRARFLSAVAWIEIVILASRARSSV